jgi:hypothetical protein
VVSQEGGGGTVSQEGWGGWCNKMGGHGVTEGGYDATDVTGGAWEEVFGVSCGINSIMEEWPLFSSPVAAQALALMNRSGCPSPNEPVSRVPSLSQGECIGWSSAYNYTVPQECNHGLISVGV